ncbi:MAG TPA: Ig-like domain-containing protein [Polyangiaceae bacterium]
MDRRWLAILLFAGLAMAMLGCDSSGTVAMLPVSDAAAGEGCDACAQDSGDAPGPEGSAADTSSVEAGSESGAVDEAGGDAGESDARAATDASPGPPTSLVILPPSPQVPVGLTLQLYAIARHADGSSSNVTSQATWTSDEEAATIGGFPGQILGNVQGMATIEAKLGLLSSTTTVTVVPAVITAMSVTPSSSTIDYVCGTSVQLTAFATYSDGSSQDVTTEATWETSAPSQVTVSSSGLAAPAGSTYHGMATISASLDAVTGNASVQVDALILASLRASPMSASIGVGGTAQMYAAAGAPDGTMCDVTSQCSWQSSAPGVASVSAGGLVTGVASGMADVSCTYMGAMSNDVPVTVQ